MSESSRSPVELEPVTCWPLIVGAVGFVALGLFTVAGLAAWSALFPPPRPEAAVAPVQEEKTPVRVEHIDLPAQPLQATPNDRVVTVRREVIHRYTPTPRPPQEDHLPFPRAVVVARRRPASRAVVKVTTRFRPAQLAESELRDDLEYQAITLDLETDKGTGQKLLEAGRKQQQLRQAAEKKRLAKKDTAEPLPPLTKTIEDLLKRRSDLRGLPLQDEKSCQLSKEDVKVFAKVSPHVRQLRVVAECQRCRYPGRKPTADLSLPRTIQLEEGDEFLRDYLADQEFKGTPALVRPLEQMFQTETPGVRYPLLDTLATIKGREATQALARRAVFDVSAAVRSRAIELLGARELADARPIFEAALRHPWAPAANHAAIALADLDDQKAIPALKKLLNAPDPASPFQEGKKWQVRELVRVNHLRNCLLCHPPVVKRTKDMVIGLIPSSRDELPDYADRKFAGEMVRVDVVYFRQDFSVMHKVSRADPWPELQRFDYMVQTRELTGKEVEAQLARLAKAKASKETPAPLDYPQRKAVQYALHALTVQATARR